MFIPPFCPRPICLQAGSRPATFKYSKCGRFRRKCDGRWVQRFRCYTCRGSFSDQTFRTNYRWRKPWLHHQLIPLLCAKVTRRQAARTLRVNRKSIDRRILRLGSVAESFHRASMAHRAKPVQLGQVVLYHEELTFEHNKRKKPLAIGLCIDAKSGFLLHLGIGQLSPHAAPVARRKWRAQLEKNSLTKRPCQRARLIRRVICTTCDSLAPSTSPTFLTSRDQLFRRVAQGILTPKSVRHKQLTQQESQTWRKPLSHARNWGRAMREEISMLIPASWGAAKTRRGLNAHCWIWLAVRNYLRGATNKERRTPAQLAGLAHKPGQWKQAFRWRWPAAFLPKRHSKGPMQINGKY